MWARRGINAKHKWHDDLLGLEASLTDPEIRKTEERLEELLHPEFVEMGSSGRVYDRQLIIQAMSQDVGDAGVVMRDFEVHDITEDAALVTYRSIGQAGDEARRSSVWVRVEGVWKLRFHQGTRIANAWGHIS